MRPIAIILVVAALAAGLTAFLAKSWLDRQTTRQVRAEQPDAAEVLVVARDVVAGTTLQSDDLRYEKWPNSAISARMIVRRGAEDPKAGFMGVVARRALAEGEPFSAAATFKTETSGVLAGLLTPGMRAVSIAISNPTAVSGFITPGDRVDILLATDIRKAEESGESAQLPGLVLRYAAETVLADIRVLAIDQQIARSRDGAPIQGKTVTVEVTSKQAELLTAAGMLGNLQLVLRGLPGLDAAKSETLPETLDFTADLEASKVLQALAGAKVKPERGKSGGGGIRINRAGQVSTEGLSQ
ncbi:Flp pilus assembly protein CpaB [Candidatus Terasakiella magnetica]|nr:Flp pilus assembly protein CpaB [Candidatus Terasakiella magnetica]